MNELADLTVCTADTQNLPSANCNWKKGVEAKVSWYRTKPEHTMDPSPEFSGSVASFGSLCETLISWNLFKTSWCSPLPGSAKSGVLSAWRKNRAQSLHPRAADLNRLVNESWCSIYAMRFSTKRRECRCSCGSKKVGCDMIDLLKAESSSKLAIVHSQSFSLWQYTQSCCLLWWSTCTWL